MDLILASQSPYRKALMENFGLRFRTVSPAVDEEALKLEGPEDPLELTRYLAFHKADSLRVKFPSSVILGADQVAECEGEILNKPGSAEKALNQLLRLQGRAHRLITSLTVLTAESAHTFTDVTTLHLRKLSASEIQSYLEVDRPFDCAGSYKIERSGLALVERLETQDPSAIQGLPMISLTNALRALGYSFAEIWEKK